MAKKIKILAVQTAAIIAEKQYNIEHVKSLLEQALLKHSDTDFVFLPEVWTCGWYCPCFKDCAENLYTAQSVKMLQELAKKYNVNIVGGSIIEKQANEIYKNTCPVIDRAGNIICTYEKNHLFSYYGDNEGEIVTAGKHPVMVNLEGINIGLTICYDIRFPEIYRAYRKAGADILVNMAAWGYKKKIPWDYMTTSRAVENQTYFVALTQTGELANGERNLGHSMIIDYKGDILDEINETEGEIFAIIDLDEMYVFRNKCKVIDDIKETYEVVKK